MPYRYENRSRDRAYKWVEERWFQWMASSLPIEEIIVIGDHGGRGDPFSRGVARNRAFSAAVGDAIIIADADTFVPLKSIVTALVHLDNGAPWVLPYDVYWNLDQATTERVLRHSPSHFSMDGIFQYEHRIEGSTAGTLIMRPAAFQAVGGYDERFVGWGYEDNAFALALDTLVGPHATVQGSAYHLWHPRNEGDNFSQPFIDPNRALYERYRLAATSPNAMISLVEER